MGWITPSHVVKQIGWIPPSYFIRSHAAVPIKPSSDINDLHTLEITGPFIKKPRTFKLGELKSAQQVGDRLGPVNRLPIGMTPRVCSRIILHTRGAVPVG